LFERQYQSQINMANEIKTNHQNSMKFIEEIAKGKEKEAIEYVTKVNEITTVIDAKAVRTVIAVDATGSMGHALQQVCNNIQKCIVSTV